MHTLGLWSTKTERVKELPKKKRAKIWKAISGTEMNTRVHTLYSQITKETSSLQIEI